METTDETRKETALHRVADSILALDATVRRLATDIQALTRDVLHLGDRRDRDMAQLRRDLEAIQRDIDALGRQLGKTREAIEENSGPHPRTDLAETEWDKPDPSVIARGKWKLTTDHAVIVIKAALIAVAGAAAKWLYDYTAKG